MRKVRKQTNLQGNIDSGVERSLIDGGTDVPVSRGGDHGPVSPVLVGGNSVGGPHSTQ